MRLVALLLGAGVLASCTDEKIVFRDRELFDEPLPAAQGMLGYSDQAAGLTTCGNCHIDAQSHWETTKHAGAWETLQASGGAQAFCEGCHTVNELGNALAEMAGYSATGEDRYHDVQCESCHGPGLDHVRNPNDQTVPLAALSVGVDLTVGCGECHQGTHHPFAEEWSQSGHGNVIASPAGRAACESCHTGEGALKAWGVTDPYVEQQQLDLPDQHMPITCGVCHDPHGSPNSAQLRFPVDVPNEEQNLCMKCHHKRGVPDFTASQRGPHSPQGPLLLGEGGWWPPNLTLPGGKLVASHGTDENPKLCAGCHLNSFEVTDAETGAFDFQATGHLFLATPCIEDGRPVPGDCDVEEKSYQVCADCHDPDVARGLLFLVQTRLNNLADEVDALLAQVPASEFDVDDNVYSTAEGSRFNSQLARFPGTAAHNPFLTEALLIASIDQLEAEYGVAASASLSRVRELGPGMGMR
jgi:predicted CXXCH cytochrome family protein